MEKLGIIYIATDTARDNLQYVGQTTRTLKRRKKGGYNPYFQRAISDHGDQIEWKIVEEVLIEELDFVESLYIFGLDTIYPNGYNFEDGGNKNKTMSKETKRKMSEARMGEKNHNFGKHPSPESRKKMSEAHIGLQAGEKHPMYGKHHSEESKRKMSEAQSGEKHRMYGEHHTEESKKKLSEGKRGQKNPHAKLTWIIVKEIRSKYATGKYTQRQLAKEYKVSNPNINRIINNKAWIEIIK